MSDDIGKLILRVVLGVCILLHGISKITGGIGGIEGMVTAHGLPGFFAYGVYVGEVVAPVLLLIGCYARIAALVIAFNMVVAVALAHVKDLFTIGQAGGWALELQAMYLFTAIAIALIGPGRFGINRR
jgi:putative oxidoreductase